MSNAALHQALRIWHVQRVLGVACRGTPTVLSHLLLPLRNICCVRSHAALAQSVEEELGNKTDNGLDPVKDKRLSSRQRRKLQKQTGEVPWTDKTDAEQQVNTDTHGTAAGQRKLQRHIGEAPWAAITDVHQQGHAGTHGTAAGQRKLQKQIGEVPWAANTDMEQQEDTGTHGTAAGQHASEAKSSMKTRKPVLLDDNHHPIRDYHFSRELWNLMLKLRAAGHECYVVGGTVRDLLMQRNPKDMDLMTSASLSQIRLLLRPYRAMIVGRMHPIALLQLGSLQVEVSSMSTNMKSAELAWDVQQLLRQDKRWWQRHRRKEATPQPHHGNQHPTWSSARAANVLKRDFTINGLLYDPFSHILFDYCGALPDCKRKVLRTLTGDTPQDCFRQDAARLLRAIRFASRLGLKLETGTAAAMKDLAGLVATLPKARLQRELSQLLQYGSAASAMQLLWRFDMLHVMLPPLDKCLATAKISRTSSTSFTNTLCSKLLTILDTQYGPQESASPVLMSAALVLSIIDHDMEQQHSSTSGNKHTKTRRKTSNGSDSPNDEQHNRMLTAYRTSVSDIMGALAIAGVFANHTLRQTEHHLLSLPEYAQTLSNEVDEHTSETDADDEHWTDEEGVYTAPVRVNRPGVVHRLLELAKDPSVRWGRVMQHVLAL